MAALHRCLLLAAFVFTARGLALQLDEHVDTEVVLRPRLKDLRISTLSKSCGDPSEGWKMMGPAAVQLGPSRGEDIWLCGRWEAHATRGQRTTGITNIAFLQDAALVGDVHDSLSKRNVGEAAFYMRLQPHQDPEASCKELGPFWRLVSGSITPSGVSASPVRICVEVLSKEGSDFITDASVLTSGTASRAECPEWALGRDLFKVPGFHMEALADEAPMMCLRRTSQKSTPVRLNVVPQGAKQDFEFLARAMPVGKDFGNESREHIFVFGPESSGSRFWNYVLAVNKQLTPKGLAAPDFEYDKDTALFHLTLPQGSDCQAANKVPVYSDFGGSVSSYTFTPKTPEVLKTVPQAERFLVDIRSLVREHRKRNDKVQVLLVVRNPFTNYHAKTVMNCGDRRKSRAEMKKAFELMSVASRFPEVKVACHEDLMSGGKVYVKSTLKSMGVEPTFLPEVFGGDAEAQMPKFTVSHCTEDMRQYSKLCPNTIASRKFAKIC